MCHEGGRHQLAFLISAMVPSVKGLGVKPCGTGDFSHAFTIRRAYPLEFLSPQTGVVNRSHHSWLGPMVVEMDGLERRYLSLLSGECSKIDTIKACRHDGATLC